MRQSHIDTPLGPLLAVASDDTLHMLEFADRPELPHELARLGPVEAGETPVHARLRHHLAAYFAGQDADFPLPLAQPGTPFRQQVWQALLAIPPGTTTTYAALAHSLNRPRAFRAVGAANGANTLAILVPCHRLTGSDGSLTGYGGGLPRKRWLIDHEARHFARHPAPVG
jgi:O-6-methylguanine DNA methyltransferase